MNSLKKTKPLLVFDINISNMTAKKTLQLRVSQPNINTTLTAGEAKSFGVSGKNIDKLIIHKTSGNPLDYVLKLGSRIIDQGNTSQTVHLKSDGKSIYQLILSNTTASIQQQVLSIDIKDNSMKESLRS